MALPQPRGNDGEADNRTEGGRRNVQQLLTDPKMQPIFSALLPKHFTAERMVRLSIMAVTRTPKLAECHPMTLLGAFVECAALGLEPNSPLQHVHLLPYWNSRLNQHEVNRIIGYRGFIDLAMRTGKVISLHADVAYQRDTFEVMHGTESVLKHVPALGAQDRGEPLAAYCHVKLVDGQAFDIVPWFDVLRIKNRSPSVQRGRSSPWDTDLDRMARKTAIRRLFSGGEAPMSIELAQATQVDERQMDYQGLAKANVDEIREALESFAHREEEQSDEHPQQLEQQRQERPTEVRTEQVDERPSWAPGDSKPTVQPGRAQATWLGMIEECQSLKDLATYETGIEATKIASLPTANRQAVEHAIAHQRSVIEADRAERDHPMAELDELEPQEFQRAGSQFDLIKE